MSTRPIHGCPEPVPLVLSRGRAPGWLLATLLALGSATGCATVTQKDVDGLHHEIAATRQAQEELRNRIDRLEARVAIAEAARAPTGAADDPMQSLPVVRLTPPGTATGPRAPDVDTSIPLREAAHDRDIVLDHSVTDTETPIDMNAVVIRQAQDERRQAATEERRSDKQAPNSGEGDQASGGHGSSPSADSRGTPKADAEFQSAIVEYNSARYAEATVDFRAFATRHPTHEAAGDALFFAGMSQVAAHHCLEARPLFESVLERYSGSDAAGRALLAMGQCEANVGHDEAARTIFNRVMSEFPKTAEAYQAQGALAGLSGAGTSKSGPP